MCQKTAEEKKYIAAIQGVLRKGHIDSKLPPDLLTEIQSKTDEGLWGYCRYASEALLILLDDNNKYELMGCAQVPGATSKKYKGHYWVQRKDDDVRLDPTKNQFNGTPKSVYENGTKRKARSPVNRATECLVCEVRRKLGKKR